MKNLVDGSILPYIEEELIADGNCSADITLNAERLLLIVLFHYGIWPTRVHRFLGTAALQCTASTPKYLCHVGASIGPGTYGWRNHQEFSDAYATASRLQRGWSWNLTGPRWGPEPCLQSCCRRKTSNSDLGDPMCPSFFWLAHTCLCAVTITKVFDTSVKRSVEYHLN